MTVEKDKDNIVKLPKWFVITILSGAVSFAGFAVTVIGNHARETKEIENHKVRIDGNAAALVHHAADISDIKTDVAVIRTRQEGTDEALDRIEVRQTAILDKLSN
tara:strand:+ start:244 stop:558 length:315 start_codon:yes stop_codon:yes gene_type:complete